MNTYIFDNRAEAETAQRFDSLDALYNTRTLPVPDCDRNRRWVELP
jgi:hypothetical protein